jgi:predicted O-methyltransferase YrrM
MRHVDIKAKIPELVESYPDWETFTRIGNLTKLRAGRDGTFFPANYESGLLLHSLVRRFRPRQILEIGTGRGFASICMARCGTRAVTAGSSAST